MSGKGNISNQSTENAFAILEYIIGQPEPLKLTDIAKSLDMNASTVSRVLPEKQSLTIANEIAVALAAPTP